VKERGQKIKSVPMQIGNDPALWRYASLQDALEANVALIAQLIRIGEEKSQSDSSNVELAESIPIEEVA